MPIIKNGIDKKTLANIFFFAILLGILYLSYLLFKPFLNEIILSGVLVTIFYPVYLKIVYWTRGQIPLAALLTCLFIVLILIVPASLVLFFLAQESLGLYNSLSAGINNGALDFFDVRIWQKLNSIKEIFDVQQFVFDSIAMLRNFIFSAATAIIKGTSQFVISLVIIFFTMFFLFIDGRSLLRKIMQLTPLPNKYDKLIWIKFRAVSYSTIVATFITALVQAVTCGIGFMIVGLPWLLAGILTFLFSFFPYIGTALIWLPSAIYLLITGQIWQGIFLIAWGLLLVSTIDNFLRPYLIKGKSDIHPLIIFFSIFGGLAIMGGWGMIFGPLIVTLAATMLHIYELEYSSKSIEK